jgi:hypothetical protein
LQEYVGASTQAHSTVFEKKERAAHRETTAAL